MNRKANRRKIPQISLILRCAAGAYLLYLVWDLREAAFLERQPLILAAVIVFALAGAALLVLSLPPLIHGDFLRPGETEEPPDEPADDPEDRRE